MTHDAPPTRRPEPDDPFARARRMTAVRFQAPVPDVIWPSRWTEAAAKALGAGAEPLAVQGRLREAAWVLDLVAASLGVHEMAMRDEARAKSHILTGDLYYTEALARIPSLEDADLIAALHAAVQEACRGKLLRRLPRTLFFRDPAAKDPGALWALAVALPALVDPALQHRAESLRKLGRTLAVRPDRAARDADARGLPVLAEAFRSLRLT